MTDRPDLGEICDSIDIDGCAVHGRGTKWDMPTMTELTFTIPRSLWLTANGRYHWADRMRRTRTLRQIAKAEARNHDPIVETVHVAAFVGYLTTGRADPANCGVVKPLLDGLVDGGLLADDDHTHVIGPTYLRDPKSPTPGAYTVRLLLTPQEIPWN